MDATGLNKNSANYVPLTPISFLNNTARIYPQRTAVLYRQRRYDWQTLQNRCRRLAGALAAHGVGRGDVVSYVAANTPELIEAHFGVPMAGAVLNVINTRLDTDTIRYILTHAESKIVFVDGEFAAKVKDAVAGCDKLPLIVDIIDADAGQTTAERIGAEEYEALLAGAGGEARCLMPEDEWEPITLNYTSGTTGVPKGVVYHHRGAYLMAQGSVVAWDMRRHNTYLYTVPLFHCNGWGYAWTQTLLAGTFICLRKIDGGEILRLIDEHKVDCLGGAPIVLAMIAEAAGENYRLSKPVRLMTAGAPPPPSILAAMERMGFEVLHVYGLTETYGHTTYCAWQEEWSDLPADKRAELQARQGVGYPILEDWAVLDKDGGRLPAGDGIGEIGLRGNTIMSGYLKNPEATAAVFAGGWFHSGDLAMLHDDQYLQVKDRLKDIIISGGENISSIAVENALCKHPAVMLAAVVAKADDKWGETPCAFLELRHGHDRPNTQAMEEFCRQHLPGYMRPRYFVFTELPKTSTGKIKKYELREQAKEIK